MKRIGVLGSGVVGQVLADGLLKHGYEVKRGSREPAKLAEWQRRAGAHGSTGTFQDAVRFADILVLAVKGDAAEAVVDLCGAGTLAGKTILDTTNPIASAPPANGVLQYFTAQNESLMERLQKKAPAANFVKVFSSVGNALMVNPTIAGGPPTMFICGNSTSAKAQAKAILDQFGWETEDMGLAEAARAIEPLCMLWCIPGFLHNRWMHAFKLLKA